MSSSSNNRPNFGPTLSSLKQPGYTAVVTGASSGIGRAACMKFVEVGMNVWMIDIDKEELPLAYEMVRKHSTTFKQQSSSIEYRVVDVSNLQQMESLANEIFINDGKCHVLMNNAGVGLGGGALSTDMTTVEKVMSINTYGPIHGCLTIGQKMKSSNEPGIIINTGSKQGITMPPGNLTYNMSKAALKTYTEGLEHELMKERYDNEKNGKLRAVLLIPGWVNTSILLKTLDDDKKDTAFFHEEKPAVGAWMPNQIIEYMISEIDTGKFYIVCPDNDVTRQVDNIRMTWTMQDITQDRPPLSRWHPDYQDQFKEYLEEELNKGGEK